MERISETIRRAKRALRRFDGKRLVAAAATFAIVLSTALTPVTSAYAATYSSMTMNQATHVSGSGWPGLHKFSVSGDGITDSAGFCGNKGMDTPSNGTRYSNGQPLGNAVADYILYHGYSSENTSGYGTSGMTFYLVTQMALWLALPDEGGSHAEVYTDLSYLESHGYPGVYDATMSLYNAGRSYASAGGGGAEEGCAVYWGSPDNIVQGMITRTVPEGYVQIKKVSANTSITNGNDMYSLAGAEFTVYDSNGSEVGTLTTDESGNTGTLTLKPGTYTVKETKTPEGFYKAEDQTVTVRQNQTATVRVADEPANDPAVMIVGKFDGERTYTELEGNMPQGAASLEGAEFTVEYYDTLDYDSYDALKEAGIQPTRKWVVATDADGYARLSEKYLVSGSKLYYASNGETTLPRGTVVVYESKAPEGYNLNTENVSFQKIQEDPLETTITYNTPEVPDDVKRGGVAVQKLDSETGETPQGNADFSNISFAIINDNENSVQVNGEWYDKGEVVATITTNEDGYASTADDALPYGEYIIRELPSKEDYANDSYMKTASDIHATVTEDKKTYNFEAHDDVVRGGVEVYKHDIESDLGTPLGGASIDGTQFEVKNLSENPVVVDGVTYGNNEVVDTLTIKDGYASTSSDALPYGHYSLQEVKVGEGYLLTDGTAYEFDITEDGVIVNPVTGDGHVHNQVKRGDFEFNKKADDSGNRLANVPFKVTSTSTGESHVVVTDENGYFSSASSWNAHTQNTNGNDWALEAGEDDVIDSSQLDSTAGVWFGLTTEGWTVDVDDSKGALPYDVYTIEELRCTANKGYQLISTTVTITRDGYTVDYGTLDDQPSGTVNISTYAYDPTDKDSSIMVGTVAIADKVTYEGVALGGEYKLVTTVVDAATGEAITVDGEPVSATHTFTAESTSGYEVVEMEVPTYELGGRTITIYEELYQVNNGSDTLIADHKDKDDVEQQLDVIAPEIGTSAKDGVDGDKNVVTDGETTVVDTVSYTNLIPGKEYTLTGTLHVKKTDAEGNVTEEALTDADGNPVTAEATFTPEAAEGTVDVTFTFDSLGLEKGTEIVAFESLELDGYELAVHADINDEGQTVTVVTPEIGTSAKDGVDGDQYIVTDPESLVVDTVSYTNLIPGKEYTVTGTLMVKGYDEDGNVTEEALTDADGNPVTAEATFTPEAAEGTVDVTFAFDTSSLEAGDMLVAFETLYKGGVELAAHADINDEGQTVTIITPEIGTTAKDGVDGDQTVVADSESSVVDTVSYTNLVPGKEYTVTGTLMVKGYDEDGNVTEEALTDADGNPVMAETTFTPEAPDGTIEVTFTFDSSDIPDGTELVAFESLERGDMELAVHADITDEAQTVTVHETAIGTVAKDGLDGDQTVIADAETTIVDTVAYTDVLPGKEYTMAGILMDAETGLPIITGEGDDFSKKDVQAFMDELTTVLSLDEEDDGEVTVDAEALSELLADNEELVSRLVFQTETFTPEEAAGSLSMDFTFDSNAVIDRLSGETKDIVVFEVLFKNGVTEDEDDGTAPVVVASELDLDNKSQTVTLTPTVIATSATDKSDGDQTLLPGQDAIITDTVGYEGLIPGEEYLLKATLYDKATGEPLSVNDKQVTAELRFTPNSQGGTVSIDLGPFDASELEGHDLVVFEELYKQSEVDGEVTDILVAEHKDINDENQTVTVTTTPDGGYFDKTGGDNLTIVLVILALFAVGGGLAFYGFKTRHAAKREDEADATTVRTDDGEDA